MSSLLSLVGQAAMIPQQVDMSPIQPVNMLKAVQMRQDIAKQQRSEQAQNMLAKALSSPGALGPDGSLTPQTFQAVAAVDPATAMQLRQEDLKTQISKAQLQAELTDAGKAKFDFGASIAGAAHDAYSETLATTDDPAKAAAEATRIRNDLAMNNGGVLGPDEVKRITSEPFDPLKAEVYASTGKGWESKAEKAKDRAEKAREADQRDARAGERITIQGSRDPAATKGWSIQDVTVDGKTSSMRVNADTGEVKPLDLPAGARLTKEGAAGQEAPAADDPRVKSEAEMIAHYQLPPLSNFVMKTPYGQAVMAKVQELNPDYTAEEFGGRTKAVKDFATGKEGNAVRSFNVAISHLNTLNTLVDALGNGDVQTINKLSNAFQTEFGSPAPTSFDSAKAIVGDEIIKAVVGGGGALADRENAQNQLDRAKSPEQLNGVISTYKDLMSGQLKGLKKQYEDTTGLKNFDARLAPETKSQLGIGEKSKFEEGKVYTDAKGHRARYENGKWVELP